MKSKDVLDGMVVQMRMRIKNQIVLFSYNNKDWKLRLYTHILGWNRRKCKELGDVKL